MTIPAPTVILEDMAFLEDWESRYQYLIDLGNGLPAMAPSLKTPDRLVKGCQSQVWLDVKIEQGRFRLLLDSDALIVKGLLALVLSAFNNQTAQSILDFDISNYFDRLDLYNHLSPTRGNGLKAVIAKIQALAATERNNEISYD